MRLNNFTEIMYCRAWLKLNQPKAERKGCRPTAKYQSEIHMNDINAKMSPGVKAESGMQKVEMAGGAEGKVPSCTQAACGGEGAATMRMPEIDVRELSDEMLMFMLQLMGPEKYGKAAPFREDAQQRAEIRGQRSEKIPESRCGFILDGADGEGVMRRESPEFRRGKAESRKLKIEIEGKRKVGDSRGGGVKAVEDNRSPSPGGIAEGLGVRRWLSEAGKQRTEIRGQRSETIPESRCDFGLHGADGEGVMRQECPEFGESGGGREGGVKAVEDNRSPSPGGIAEGLGVNEHRWGVRRWLNEGGKQRALQQRTEVRGQRSETIPESRGDFVLHEADGEGVMPRECPEFRRGKAESRKLKIEIEGKRKVGDSREGGVKAVEDNRSPSPGGMAEGLGENEHHWGVRRWVSEGGRQRALQQRTEIRGQRSETKPESRGDFVLHGADGEGVMRQECPEFWPGKAENRKLKIEIEALRAEKPNGKGRDQMTEIRGQRGSSGQWAGVSVGGAGIFRQQRDAAGDSRTPESACDFIWQGTDGEILMRHECQEFSRLWMGSDGGSCHWRRSAEIEVREDSRRKLARDGDALTGLTELPECGRRREL